MNSQSKCIPHAFRSVHDTQTDQPYTCFCFASAPNDVEALPSVEQGRGSPDAPLKGFDSPIPPSTTVDDAAGSDGISSEEEEEGERVEVAKKSKAVDAEALFGDESSDSPEGGDASPVEAAASEPQPARLHSQDLFGEADDISS